MQNQQQGMQSTKLRSQQQTQLISEAKLLPESKRRDVCLTIYEPKETFYAYQTGKFLHRLSQGNKYQIILQKMMGTPPGLNQTRQKRKLFGLTQVIVQNERPSNSPKTPGP